MVDADDVSPMSLDEAKCDFGGEVFAVSRVCWDNRCVKDVGGLRDTGGLMEVEVSAMCLDEGRCGCGWEVSTGP